MKWITRIIWLLLAAGLGTAQAAEPVCAQVKVEIQQELTLERQAFDAMMRINNGLTDMAIDNVNVTVHFADEDGNGVVATSDPNSTDPNAKFFIRVDTMSGITDVSGFGSVAPSSSAEIHWLIIPVPGAAGGAPQGKLYYVGASLSYTLGGTPESVEVTPDFITVKPMPQLALDYFLTKEVIGDDAFTPLVEPPEPYTLGVRVSNTGTGAASSVKIDSAQPKIVENEQGLLIGFTITGSTIDDQPALPTLLIDFGTLESGASRTGRWIMETTLSGQFVSFISSVSHSDALGGAITSLIDPNDVNTHFLLRDVRVDLPGRDNVRDFLAYPASASIAGLTVYESDNVDQPVENRSTSATLVLNNKSGNEHFYTLTIPTTAGFAYAQLPDPHGGQLVVKSAVRSDGKVIPLDNAWTSKTRNRNTNPPSWEYWLNLFDANTTGTYIIHMGEEQLAPLPPVLQPVNDIVTVEGGSVSFVMQAGDPNGDLVSLSVSPMPPGAVFTDNHDGTGHFSWNPAIGQAGVYLLTLKASDGVLHSTRTVAITVNPAWDSDGDGMDDAWEMLHFGNLDRDGNGDADGDGVSDYDEFLLGYDPNMPPPEVPSGLIALPGNGEATVSWSAVTGATKFRIYWSDLPGVTRATGQLIDDAVSPQVHGGLSNGVAYHYVVTSIGPGGESAESVEVSVTPGLRDWGAPGVLGGSVSANGVMAVPLGDGALAAWIDQAGISADVWAAVFDPTYGWTTPVRVELDDGADTQQLALVAQADGSAHVAWLQSDGVNDALAASHYQGGAWSAPVTLATATVGGLGDLQLTGETSPRLFWTLASSAAAPDSLWSADWSGTWSTANRVDDVTTMEIPEFAVAKDATGRALAAWVVVDSLGGRSLRFSTDTGSGWQPSQVIRANLVADPSASGATPRLAMNPAGEALLLWGEAASPNSLWSAPFNFASGWQPPARVELDDLAGAYTPALAIADDGSAAVAWIQESAGFAAVQVSRYQPASGWSAAQTISESDAALHLLDASAPALSISTDGAIQVAWLQDDGVQQNVWSSSWNGAAWSTQSLIDTENLGDAAPPVLVPLSGGDSLGVWAQADGTGVTVRSNQYAVGNSGAPNIPPVAVADSQTVDEESTVVLDGSGSFDQDGIVAGHAWTQTGGAAVVLTGANSAAASFTAPAVTQVTTLTFQLSVADDEGASSDRTVTIEVQPVNEAPTVDAGLDRAVDEQTAVIVAATAADTDGTITTYAWSQLSGPTVVLTDAATAQVSFTAPVLKQPADVVLAVTVTDNEGATASDQVAITVQPVNTLPVANAGPDQTVDEQMPVTLAGSAADPDSDGLIVGYQWLQISGTPVTLSGADTATAGFTAPTRKTPETLVFELRASDDEDGVGSDQVTITVQPVNNTPAVNAGADQTVDEQVAVTLSGSATDPDADGVIAAYVWHQTGGTPVTLAGADTTTATFMAPTLKAATVLTFELQVTDDEGGVGTDSVSVTVMPVNTAPVVNAGTDFSADEQTAVSLNGSATDPDADGGIVAYQWTQVSGTPVVLSGADTAAAVFTAPTLKSAAQLGFELRATDDEGASASDLVVVTILPVNQAPVVDAGVDFSADEQTTVNLSGTATDPDADGSVVAFVWVQTSGQPVALNGTGANVSFVAPTLKSGAQLGFELRATDDEGGVGSAQITITVLPVNAPPVVDAGSDQTVDELTPVMLSGTASDPDADGVLATVAWTQTGGAPVALNTPDQLTTTFDGPMLKSQSVLTFVLSVTDDEGGVTSDQVTVTVNPVNHPPVIDPVPPRSEPENSVVTLTANATDPDADGAIVSYLWTQVSGPAVSLTGVNTASASFTGPSVYEDVDFGFQLTVTDDEGGVTQASVQITVFSTNPDDDADGMEDLWEVFYFGDLSHDGTADTDSDGATDLQEFGFGTDPTVAQAPDAPTVVTPDDEEVTSLQPVLTVANAPHHPAFPVSYEFEVYADAALTQRVAQGTGVAEAAVETSWQVSVPLNDNQTYVWRARAVGWVLAGPWVSGEMFVNQFNDAPGPVTISAPLDGVWVDTFNPTLSVANSTDIDGDELSYGFEVFAENDTALPVAEVTGLVPGAGGFTDWLVNVSLIENQWYLWQAYVVDEHGAVTESPQVSFFVNTQNDAPGAPAIVAPALGEEVTQLAVTLSANGAVDPEAQPISYWFELDTVGTFNSVDLTQSPAIAATPSGAVWTVDQLRDNTRYYWRVKSSDGEAESVWVQGEFFVNQFNDAPESPVHLSPAAGEWAEVTGLVLAVTPANDVDGDALSYEYEVWRANRDYEPRRLVASGSTVETEWLVAPELERSSWFVWRARALDEHGLYGAWSDYSPFYADMDGVNDPPEFRFRSIRVRGDEMQIRWSDRDRDSNAAIALYYDTDASGEDGTLIVEGIPEDPDSSGDRYTWDISALDPAARVYLYAVITDGENRVVVYTEEAYGKKVKGGKKGKKGKKKK